MVEIIAEKANMDVARSAQRALRQSPFFALRELAVECRGKQLLISGKLETFYQKQLAQEAIREIALGFHVVNETVVSTEMADKSF